MITSSLFSEFDLPTAFDVNLDKLESAFLKQSRSLHPDLQGMDADTRSAAIERIAELNEAYAILKNPLRRAEHLADLLGAPSASEARDMPAEFLMEVLELREEVDACGTDGADKPAGKLLAERFKNDLVCSFASISASIARLLTVDDKSVEALKELRQQINGARYLEGLLRDLQSL